MGAADCILAGLSVGMLFFVTYRAGIDAGILMRLALICWLVLETKATLNYYLLSP